MILEFRIALTVDDFEAARAFYEKTLGLEAIAEWDNPPGRGMILQIKNATLELVDGAQAELIDQVEVGQRVSGKVRFALQLADVEAGAAQIIAAGATPVHETVVTPWGDHNQRVQAPDGMQLTLYEVTEK